MASVRDVVWLVVGNPDNQPVNDVIIYNQQDGFLKPINVIPTIQAHGTAVVSVGRGMSYQLSVGSKCHILEDKDEQIYFNSSRLGETRTRD